VLNERSCGQIKSGKADCFSTTTAAAMLIIPFSLKHPSSKCVRGDNLRYFAFDEFAGFGSSNCSQIATLKPAFQKTRNVSTYGVNGSPHIGRHSFCKRRFRSRDRYGHLQKTSHKITNLKAIYASRGRLPFIRRY
jgi:hypothetical protein